MMSDETIRRILVFVLCIIGAFALYAQQTTPDLILSNGKIITVDERFTIAQALAIKADRIIAVGTNSDITRLAGPATRRVDLRGDDVRWNLVHRGDAHRVLGGDGGQGTGAVDA